MPYLCNMISISRHIELLLLEHDCVIVPGLGGFIANHADAQYTGGEERLFLPPYRTIGFNQQLQVNDGLLVQSYMSVYDTSYPSAYLQMEKDLERMMCELEMKGEYVLENIGTLKKGLNQNISFISLESGVLTPSLYGLYSYEMKSLKHVIKEKDIQRNIQATAIRIDKGFDDTREQSQDSKQKDVVIHLNRRWLDFGISAAAAVLLFFCFSYLAMESTKSDADTVVAAFPSIKTSPKPTVSNIEVNATKGNPLKKVMTEVPNEEARPSEKVTKEIGHVANEQNPTLNKASEGKFTIVLATYVSQKSSEQFIESLAKDGFNEGRYTKNGKVSRILYSEYTNEADAQKALASLRQQNSAFAEAWILEL